MKLTCKPPIKLATQDGKIAILIDQPHDEDLARYNPEGCFIRSIEDAVKRIEKRLKDGGKPFEEAILPEKLSEVIEVAKADFLKIFGGEEPDPFFDYAGSSYWVRSRFGGCSICLAGAVMIGSIGVPSDSHAGPELFCRWNRLRLIAIDHIRTGNWAGALVQIYRIRDIDKVLFDQAVEELSAILIPDSPHLEIDKFVEACDSAIEILKRLDL
jgi:hypothetical protein